MNSTGWGLRAAVIYSTCFLLLIVFQTSVLYSLIAWHANSPSYYNFFYSLTFCVLPIFFVLHLRGYDWLENQNHTPLKATIRVFYATSVAYYAVIIASGFNALAGTTLMDILLGIASAGFLICVSVVEFLIFLSPQIVGKWRWTALTFSISCSTYLVCFLGSGLGVFPFNVPVLVGGSAPVIETLFVLSGLVTFWIALRRQ